MATVTASVFSAAITFKVQKKVLENLRASLVYADSSLAEQGEFQPGFDTLVFGNVPDLAVNTTPLTEGSPPTAKSLSLGTTTVSTDQYGDLVEVTDLAKIKSPFQVIDIASERLSRQAQESIDQITRDVIYVGGTHVYRGKGNPASRTAIAADDFLRGIDLIWLRAKMMKAKIPMPADGYYRLMVNPSVAYDLRTDTGTGAWIDVNKYATPETILRGEVGRMHGFRVQEVVNAPTFSSSQTVYASLALGTVKGWGAGELQTLSTHHVAPGGDHTDPLAQKELLGWKVNFGVAVLNNSYYFVVETCATTI